MPNNFEVISILENGSDYLGLIFFVAISLFMLVIAPFFNGRFGPWAKLKELYTFMGNPSGTIDGEKRMITFLKLGKYQYKGIVRITVTSQGIYLRPVFIFKLAHPTLFIPWNEITFLGEEDFPKESRTRTGLVLKGSKFQAIRFEFQFQRFPSMKVEMDEDTGLFVEKKKKEFGF